MKKEEIVVRVFDIVGGPLCVSASDGQSVYEKIVPLLKEGKKVVVSFAGVETLISAFLNAAIGQLYGGDIPEDSIRKLLSVRDLADSDMTLLKRVVDNAKRYFANPKRFDKAWQQELGEGGEDEEE